MPFSRNPYGIPMGPMKNLPSWFATNECFSAVADVIQNRTTAMDNDVFICWCGVVWCDLRERKVCTNSSSLRFLLRACKECPLFAMTVSIAGYYRTQPLLFQGHSYPPRSSCKNGSNTIMMTNSNPSNEKNLLGMKQRKLTRRE